MPSMRQLAHIFRCYDIRGDASSELTPDIGYQIVHKFAQQFEHKPNFVVTVAYDGRLSSHALSQAVIRGLNAAGATVHNVGCGPTPYLYFCDHYFKSDAAIMITGSHNLGHINGLKMVVNRQPFWGDDILKLYKRLIDVPFPSGSPIDLCQMPDKISDMSETYVEYICSDYHENYPSKSQLKIVWDPGNGATGGIVAKIIKKIPGHHTVINGDIDGTFPNHHPDPTLPENLRQLIATVRQTNSDLGIAFDGDGDRIGVVTATGNIMYGEHLLELLVPEVLQTHPNSTIIADVKTSQHFLKIVHDLGGTPLLWKTGHSSIKAKMRELSAPFAAEMSGHIFFADRYLGYDDGLYTALRVIGLVNQNRIDLDIWLAQRPKFYTTPEIRIDCQQKFDVISKVQFNLKLNNMSFSDIDGIRIDESNGWWMMRASHTQELIVVRAESIDQHQLMGYIDTIIRLLIPFSLDLGNIINFKNKIIT